MRWNVLLGDQPSWRERVYKLANFDDLSVSKLEFNKTTVECPEIDFVLPLTLADYKVTLGVSTAAAKYLMPQPATVGIANDKLIFNRWLISNGFREFVPRILQSGSYTFPLIKKKRIDEWGTHSKIVAVEDFLAELGTSCQDFFLQEYIAGSEEFVTHTISVRGSIAFASTFKNTYGTDIFVKGAGIDPISVDAMGGFVPLELSGILHKLKYTGCACFNYKYAGGLPKIFELNPRVGGSFTLDLHSYLRAYIRIVSSQQVTKKANIRPIDRIRNTLGLS